MSASPSMAGDNRGLWALRIPLDRLGARAFPDTFSKGGIEAWLAAGYPMREAVPTRRAPFAGIFGCLYRWIALCHRCSVA